ncbi:MAG TPA: ABC transporter permease [Solirubrobacteraceae bacterium]|nr:ABC transporter permease [Solirubrobacteraceae bacterium]
MRTRLGGSAARLFPVALIAAAAVTLAFLALPVIAIFTDVSPSELLDSLDDPTTVDALRLSLETTVIALAVILLMGTPVAWVLATRRFRGRSVLVTVLELPVVLPPAVAGIGLLAALGPHGILGPALDSLGITLVFQTAGVVVALVFVASPFYLRQAQASFESLDPALLEASRTLGASEARTFARVGVPVAVGGLLSGAALSWGRALGEFGATLIFAGSFQGITQTAPLAIYAQFGTNFPGALTLAAVLVCVSIAILGGVKVLGRFAQPL